MPTAFKAVYGSGKPVIGFLAEYDALPELSQEGGCTMRKKAAGITRMDMDADITSSEREPWRQRLL